MKLFKIQFLNEINVHVFEIVQHEEKKKRKLLIKNLMTVHDQQVDNHDSKQYETYFRFL